RLAQSGALPDSAVAAPPYWSCRQPALQPSRPFPPAEREVARCCILHLREGEVAALTSPVKLHVGREPRHRGTARVGGRPCCLQFLMHLLEEGDATRNWCGGASVELRARTAHWEGEGEGARG